MIASHIKEAKNENNNPIKVAIIVKAQYKFNCALLSFFKSYELLFLTLYLSSDSS